jgi:hypothetical protein
VREDDQRRLFLASIPQPCIDMLDERNPRLRDLEAERNGRRKATFDNSSAVDEQERARNRELFLHECARSSRSASAASVEREEREAHQRMKKRAIFYERETRRHPERKGSGSVGRGNDERKTG